MILMAMAVLVICLLLLIFLFSAWNVQTPVSDNTQVADSNLDSKKCGDGICAPPENAQRCPADCHKTGSLSLNGTQPAINDSSGQQPLPQPGQQSDNTTVLLIGIMVHLEGWNSEANIEDQFNEHKEAVRAFASVVEDNGAKATFEAKPEFVKACDNWGDNVLQELLDAGHGIGIHADAGGQVRPGDTSDGLSAEIAKMKTDMKALVGIDPRHVSGICSTLDWVTAAVDAGYKFTTGAVGYCAMSLPLSERPDEYSDCRVPSECHGAIPVDLKDRIHPWRASSGDDWMADDPIGEIVILPAGNLLKGLAEEASGLLGASGPSLGLNEDDIDTFMSMLDEALSYAEAGKTNMLYTAVSIGDKDIDTELYDKLLKRITPYITSGKVRWATLPEIYDEYVENGFL